MQPLLREYAVPFAVTCAGLVIALILGVAPMIQRASAPQAAAIPAPTVVAAASAPQMDPSTFEALQATATAQAGTIDSLTNRVQTLEKGISRLNLRLVDQKDVLAGLGGLGPDVARTQLEIAILNKAVPRLNARLLDQRDTVARLEALSPTVSRSASEIAILNKAVPRLNAKVTTQRDAVDSLPELQRQVSFLEGQMRILNTAVPRLQARIKALQTEIGE